MTKARWIACAVLVAFGVIRIPIEDRLAADLKAHQFHEMTIPDGSMREQLGQLGAAAALGGFRSFLATMFELNAIAAYRESDYANVETRYQLVTQLQPSESGYWETAAWMMDSNARRFYLGMDNEVDVKAQGKRGLLAQRAVERGRRFLDDGLRYHPGDYKLQIALGNHLVERQRPADFCGAAEAFAKAIEARDDATLPTRHHALNLALCPGHEREAYVKLRAIAERLVRGDYPIPLDQIPASLILHMRYLEEYLKIAEDDRFPINLDVLRRLYARLRPGFDPATNTDERHAHVLRRLEDVLAIPEGDRIRF